MFDAGLNYGVTGILNIGTTSASQMVVTVRGFGSGLHANKHNITGPGSNYNEKWYSSNVGGSGTWEGECQPDKSPIPPTMHNLKGTLTLQYSGTTSTLSCPVLIDSTGINRNEKNQNMWISKGTWTKDGPYTLNWNGTTSYTQPTLLLTELFAGTSITYDNNALTTRATETWFIPLGGSSNSDEITAITGFNATASAPVSGLQINTNTIERLDDGAAIMHVSWSLLSTVQQVTYPATSSYRSTIHPNTDSDANVVASSSTLPLQANAYIPQFQTENYFDGLRLTNLTPGQRKLVKYYVNPGVLVTYNSQAGTKIVSSRINSSNSDIEVYLAQNSAYGTGRRLVLATNVENLDYGREILDITILRHLPCTVIPRQNPQTINGVTLPFYWQASNATFLGFPAGKIVYTTGGGRFNAGLQGTTNSQTQVIIAYKFHGDTTGIILGEPKAAIGRLVIVNSTVSSTGWVSAAGLGPPFNAMYTPSQASFLAFTTYPP